MKLARFFVPALVFAGSVVSVARAQRPLERLAAEQMVVLPVQYLTFADSLGWSQGAPSTRSFLGTLDDEIAFALSERGLRTHWTMAPDLERAVGRNQGYAPDPRALSAGEIRSGQKDAEWQLREPLASQLRALLALTDARYVLFPVTRCVSPDPTAPGTRCCTWW